jgi:hypothetical protein
VQGVASQAGDLFNLQTSGGVDMFKVSATGTALFKNSTNSATALQVQNATGTAILSLNTVSGSENLTLSSSLTTGYVSNIKAAEVGVATYTEATAGTAYYLSANSTTTNASFTTTFNITGAPTTDGTIVVIKASSIKGITVATQIHTVVVQLNGGVVATLAPATNTTAQTVTRSMIFMRMNGVWTLIGQPATANVANTTNSATTADFAEWIHYSGDTQPQPGELLMVGDENTSVKTASLPYERRLVGVVSTNPYQVGGADDGHSVVLALTGRVPVKVSLENGPVQKGDLLTSSSTPGVAMKALKAGNVIGTALTDYDGTQQDNLVTVQLRVGYDEPEITMLSTIQGASLNVNGAATINGNTTIGGSLYVSGATALTNLTVTGDAIFTGNLTVQNISVANITINGHIITAGNAPAVAVGAAAGVADPLNNIAAPNVTITGNDTSGTITVVAGANTSADELAKVTFNTAFGAKPKVVFTAANRDSTKLGAYYDESTTSTTGFSILTDNAPQTGKVYTFTYFIVQ